MIKAQRNGVTKWFDEKLWNDAPKNKYGYVPVAEEPDEVKAIASRAHVVTKADVKNNPDLAGLEGKTIGIPVKASNLATKIKKLEESLAKGNHGKTMSDKMVQELASLKQKQRQEQKAAREAAEAEKQAATTPAEETDIFTPESDVAESDVDDLSGLI